MKLTNRLGLPLPIVKAVEADSYDNYGTLSVTTLLRPPQAYALSRKHKDEVEEDVADRIWSLVGQIGHLIIERAAGTLDPNVWVTERRYFADVAGELVSGQADLIHVEGGVVYDNKFTSGWAVKDALEKGKEDWQLQLSMLAYLARRGAYRGHDGDVSAPVDIKQGKIIAIMRDWTELQAMRNNWPEKPVAVIDMDILSDAEIEAWMVQRIAEFKDATNGSPRPCTDEERWHNPGKWAVYKGANIKAAKLADSEDELSAWIFANRAKVGSAPRIEQRPAEYKRCAKYCSAASFCSQHLRDAVPEALATQPLDPADMD